ncbi:hypothetical protein F4823DRAFT_191262 [Ustulina deusta]|nr:hypothetical protein F4823DRAFT_191262 [Ustulina deusta]
MVGEIVPRNDRILKANKISKTAPLTSCMYEGKGQVVAIADTVFEKGNTGPVYPALISRIEKLQLWAVPKNCKNTDDHGTHVCGLATGDGQLEETGLLVMQCVGPQLRKDPRGTCSPFISKIRQPSLWPRVPVRIGISTWLGCSTSGHLIIRPNSHLESR